MKVIDKTPFQDQKGSFGLWQRVQAGMEYGFAWQKEVEAQQPVITQLDRVLEKGYTLIRNLNLENSKILEPMILVGPGGVFVLYVAAEKGSFEAKGDEWIVVHNDRRVPAAVNPLTRAARLARALQVYLNRQGMILPCMVEAVLIAGNPAVHVDALRPSVRVVLSDAIKQWAASLLQARPVLRNDLVFEVVDRLLNPRSKTAAPPAQAGQADQVAPTAPEAVPAGEAPSLTEPANRARVIFQAAEEAKPFNPADLDFEFDEKAPTESSPQSGEKGASQPPKAGRRALSGRQLVVLVVMLFVELGVVAAFLYMIFFGSR